MTCRVCVFEWHGTPCTTLVLWSLPLHIQDIICWDGVLWARIQYDVEFKGGPQSWRSPKSGLSSTGRGSGSHGAPPLDREHPLKVVVPVALSPSLKWISGLGSWLTHSSPTHPYPGTQKMLCLLREFPVSVTLAVRWQTKHHGRHLVAYKAQHGNLCNGLEGWYLRLDDTGIPEMASGECIWLCLKQKKDAINVVYS